MGGESSTRPCAVQQLHTNTSSCGRLSALLRRQLTTRVWSGSQAHSIGKNAGWIERGGRVWELAAEPEWTVLADHDILHFRRRGNTHPKLVRPACEPPPSTRRTLVAPGPTACVFPQL